MPPRTRTRGAKALKENADVENNYKVTVKFKNLSRKILADKTNSLSDDNETINEIKKASTKLSLAIENNGRPRRQKRIPSRFKENQVLNNLSNQNNSITSTTEKAPKTAKELSSKENNQVTPQKQAPKHRKKVINRVKNKNTSPVTQENDISPTKDRVKHQNNTKSFTSGNIMTTKVVHNKKGNIVVNKKTIADQGKQLKPSKSSTKPEEAQRKNTSDLKDKLQKLSKNSEKSAISNTFSPPPHKDPNFLEKSLIINRPKRIHRLPSRYEDHSVSPSKFIPVQPCHASTPIQKNHSQSAKQTQTKQPNIMRTEISKSHSIESDKKLSNKTSPDSNNNPKSTRSARLKGIPKVSLVKKSPIRRSGKRLLDKSLSFKILEDNQKSKDDAVKLDVYEFTFDPDEEPLQQKKKKKRMVKKKPSKPKTVTFKNNYDKNISKAMAALKDAVAKYVHPKDSESNNKIQAQNVKSATQVQRQHDNQNKILLDSNIKPQNIDIENQKKVTQPPVNTSPIICNVDAHINNPLGNNGDKSVYEDPPSIRIEDIEADCEISYHDDINYSPANSPRPSSLNPMAVTQNFNTEDKEEHIERAVFNKDPLNLQEDISFFDDQPAASSSMNVSVRHPLASPWRVEFGSLPIKWQANTYLKPNMTPAVESSFISSEDSNKKKHVYVNMIPQTNETLPQIVENSVSNLKQTSIISFMKEVAERNANKKKWGKSVSPIKASTLFEDITNEIISDDQKTTSKKDTNKAIFEETANKNVSNSSSNTSNDKENIRMTRKRKKENTASKLPAKSPHREKDKNVTYFGFDDSENQDQENVLPNKNIDNNKVRALRSRSKVLQEINGQIEPARAALLLTAKNKITSSSEAVKKMYDGIISAEDSPQFLEENNQQNAGVTNVAAIQNEDIYSEEGESVHLFEDIDVVHYVKPTRKSYGKAKKVTFRQRSVSDSDTHASDEDNNLQSSDQDDLADLSFTMPEINQEKKKVVRKKKSKKIMSKKEEKEADEWAAGFNSMCEDIEEFPLVVE